jgi:endo-1,4-beta-xylanase
MEKLEKIGLQIFITELDVDDGALQGGIRERDRRVASVYGCFLENVLVHSTIVGIITWQLSDRDSWLQKRKPARTDRKPKRPLLFSNRLRPKPAFFAVRDVLAS